MITALIRNYYVHVVIIPHAAACCRQALCPAAAALLPLPCYRCPAAAVSAAAAAPCSVYCKIIKLSTTGTTDDSCYKPNRLHTTQLL
jgi:hypothetical protein